MKVLYGIQGTGHGHISRAREILPELTKSAEVDVLMSGTNCKMTLQGLDVSQRRGLTLAYDSNGGVSYLKTALELNPIRFLKDVQSLDVRQYDLVISDYEPISSWAAIKEGITCIGLSHQAAFLSDRTPRPPAVSTVSEHILKRFAPCHRPIGFHFLRYDRFIEGPVIRSEIRQLTPTESDHITVYLPAFDHETLTAIFSDFKQIRWEIFSPLCESAYTKNNMTIQPVGNETFLKSLESCAGVITSAGFETCAESIYLGKKLMAVPIKNQYEQLCNAEALKKMGVPVAQVTDTDFPDKILDMLSSTQRHRIPEIADARRITKKLLRFAERQTNRQDRQMAENSV
ncbi:glycosyltransferase family protein [Rhodohalobacter sp. 8-1]|uniref:glycosyltransferase family protein n=1 Tax=Rhodohalobacter sp. 8-1 TaxID=3131972 RepID=UPI0030EB2791